MKIVRIEHDIFLARRYYNFFVTFERAVKNIYSLPPPYPTVDKSCLDLCRIFSVAIS